MKIGDLVKAWSISDNKSHIGVVTEIAFDYRYKVFFPNAPQSWWNEGTWNKRALELV